MKILLIGEYSNVHWTLAQGLRQLGCTVTVISNGDFWKDYPRDIDVSRQSGKVGGIRLMIKLWSLLPKMRGYDVVQLINPMFFELKAERLFWFYDYLRKHNKKVFLGGFGMDWYWIHTCINNKPLRYSDFNLGDKIRTDAEAIYYQKDWIGTAKEQLNKMIAEDSVTESSQGSMSIGLVINRHSRKRPPLSPSLLRCLKTIAQIEPTPQKRLSSLASTAKDRSIKVPISCCERLKIYSRNTQRRWSCALLNQCLLPNTKS